MQTTGPTGRPHRNHGLFSYHYLNGTLPERQDWRSLAGDAGATIAEVSRVLEAYAPSQNEAKTEEDLVRPVLRLLGHEGTYEVQPALATPEARSAPTTSSTGTRPRGTPTSIGGSRTSCRREVPSPSGTRGSGRGRPTPRSRAGAATPSRRRPSPASRLPVRPQRAGDPKAPGPFVQRGVAESPYGELVHALYVRRAYNLLVVLRTPI